MPSDHRLLRLFTVLAIGYTVSLASGAASEGINPTHRPIAEIRIEGLDRVSDQLVRNHIRSRPGDPYDPDVVNGDISRITHLGGFDAVIARVEPRPDGSVVLIFDVVEQDLLADVQILGNKAISDQELLKVVLLNSGDPAAPFLIERGIRQIKEAYKGKGYFEVLVELDQDLLDESGILVYRVREGPKVRIKAISFEGNKVFTKIQIKSHLRSKTHIPIFRQGEFSREELDHDEARIRDFYHDRGYLEANVYSDPQISPDGTDAVVVFVIEEGPQYVVDQVRTEGNMVFPTEQIRRAMTLGPGDIYSQTQLRKSRQAILRQYGKLGFIETQINRHDGRPGIDLIFHEDAPKVNLLIHIEEGRPSLVGTVTVRGNELTKNKVILRQLRGMNPGRRFDRAGVDETRRRLSGSSLFNEGTVTILGEAEDEVRDVLIDVKEARTGSVQFGAGVSSDLGILGAIDLTQRNFDITDFPESFKELVTGQAFRGAGQFFSLQLQPGGANSRYSMTFRDPYWFETDYIFDSTLFFFKSEREDWDEERLGSVLGLGHRFGDVWSGSIKVRGNRIDIRDINRSAPVDAFEVAGTNDITGVGFVVTRNTTDSFIFPTRGNKIELGLERVGALGGDFNFTRMKFEFRQFWTVDEDFFGRKTVLSLRTNVGYIFEDDEAPLFERFYAGGHRTFRGFEFRGVGPRSIRADTLTLGDDPVGGDWLLLASLEYNFPILQEVLRAVFFTDMGTVQDDLGIEDWRVSIGTGIRLKIPFLGQAPFAIDIAVPLVQKYEDEEQVVSFNLALPLQ